jgi:hypothetical protein
MKAVAVSSSSDRDRAAERLPASSTLAWALRPPPSARAETLRFPETETSAPVSSDALAAFAAR